jgi:hypothetical protein
LGLSRVCPTSGLHGVRVCQEWNRLPHQHIEFLDATLLV